MCVNCQHYELYKMITSGKPFGYAGDIPCQRCVHYGKNDEFKPVNRTGWTPNYDRR